MCIAILANRYTRLQVILEHILLSFSGCRLKSREIYDIVFSLDAPWPNARMLCISPHALLGPEGLSVSFSPAPGSGGPDDVLYTDSVMCTASFDHENHLFEVNLPKGLDERNLVSQRFSGSVIMPKACLPEQFKGRQQVQEIMEECGTAFELDLGDLDQGHYMFRMIIEPHRLLGLVEPRAQGDRLIDEVLSVWVQDAVIMCPNACLFNYMSLLSAAREVSEYAETAATVQAVVGDTNMLPTPVEQHQTVVIPPLGAELTRMSTEGSAWTVSTRTLQDGRHAAIFGGGVYYYWMDDPESVACKVYEYFQRWAVAQPKKKEDVSIAIEASHENCSLIVDSLCQFGALKEADPGSANYRAVSKTQNELKKIFEAVATSDGVRRDFSWQGYQIRYTVQYRYLCPEDMQKLSAKRAREWRSYVLGVAALIAGVLGIVLSIVSILLYLLT